MESWWFYVGKSGNLTTLTLWRHDDSSSLRSHSLPLHNFAHQNNPSTWCTKMHFWFCINLSSLLLFIYHRDNMNAYLEKSRAVFFCGFRSFLAVGLFAATCTHSIVHSSSWKRIEWNCKTTCRRKMSKIIFNLFSSTSFFDPRVLF